MIFFTVNVYIYVKKKNNVHTLIGIIKF